MSPHHDHLSEDMGAPRTHRGCFGTIAEVIGGTVLLLVVLFSPAIVRELAR